MSKQNNVIVINGKKYDALTGKLLDGTAPPARKQVRPQAGIAMDGVVHPKTLRTHATSALQPAKKVHGAQEKSKTLMRSAVKKPVTHKLHGKAAPAAPHTTRTTHTPAGKTAHKDASRLARVGEIPKSPLISKFGIQKPNVANPIIHKTAVLPVKQAPAHTAARNQAAAQSTDTHGNSFEKAIEQAVSHQEKAPKKPRLHHRVAHKLQISPRAVSLSAFVLSAVLLSGFLTYQNVPNVAMQVAASRSGVRAELPAYKPAGFKVNGPIQYSTGQITVQYKSKTDDRSFAVSQTKSAWNSETLLENFINEKQYQYQTYQDKGKTIYIYDGTNATWVDSGVWYQIEGESALNSDQLLRIANSL